MASVTAGGVLRHAGLRELALVAAVYSAYDGSRVLVEGHRHDAFANADAVMDAEHAVGLAFEHALNTAVSAHAVLAVTADYLYATTHYIVTPLVLIWLWRRHRGCYSRARTALMVATILGLVGFTILPVAPPRMLPGYVDTMADYSQYGWWSSDASAPRGVGQWTNEFAAMPSLHVGWALWCGWQLVRHARAIPARTFGVAYPIVTALVVVGTGNHWVLDAIAGVVVIAVSCAVVHAAWELAGRQPSVIDLNDASVPAPRPPQLDASVTTETTASESVVIPETPRPIR